MMRRWLCQADVTLELHPVDPILIKSGYATLDGPDMVPVTTLREGKQVYFFPGSSLKGVLRCHFERIARTLRDGSVCLPYYDPKKKDSIPVPVASEEASFGCGYRGEDKAPTADYYRQSCAACRLFGSLRFGGRFSIGDAYPVAGKDPKPSHRNGVGIDRFTGGTVKGVLFDLTVLEGGVFATHIRVVNFELWQLAAINFLLTDLQQEMIAIGSGRSRGLGRVRGEVKDYTLSYLRPVETLRGLCELATPEERDATKGYGLFETPFQGTSILLGPAMRRGLRSEYKLPDWETRLDPLAGSLEQYLQWSQWPKHAGAVH